METSKSIPTGKGTILADVLPSSCAIRVASKTRNQQNQQRLEICSHWGSSPWWTQKQFLGAPNCSTTPPSETIIQYQLNHIKSSLFLIYIGNHWWNGVTFQSSSVFFFGFRKPWLMIFLGDDHHPCFMGILLPTRMIYGMAGGCSHCPYESTMCSRIMSKIQTVHWIYLWMISNGGYKRHMSHESYTSVDALICQGLD
jgi:hypothetical protein